MTVEQFPTEISAEMSTYTRDDDTQDIAAILSALIEQAEEDLPGHFTLREFINIDDLKHTDCLVIGLKDKEPQAYNAYAFLFSRPSYDLPYAKASDFRLISRTHFPDGVLETIVGQTSDIAIYLNENPFIYHCDEEKAPAETQTTEQAVENKVILPFSNA